MRFPVRKFSLLVAIVAALVVAVRVVPSATSAAKPFDCVITVCNYVWNPPVIGVSNGYWSVSNTYCEYGNPDCKCTYPPITPDPGNTESKTWSCTTPCAINGVPPWNPNGGCHYTCSFYWLQGSGGSWGWSQVGTCTGDTSGCSCVGPIEMGVSGSPEANDCFRSDCGK